MTCGYWGARENTNPDPESHILLKFRVVQIHVIIYFSIVHANPLTKEILELAKPGQPAKSGQDSDPRCALNLSPSRMEGHVPVHKHEAWRHCCHTLIGYTPCRNMTVYTLVMRVDETMTQEPSKHELLTERPYRCEESHLPVVARV